MELNLKVIVFLLSRNIYIIDLRYCVERYFLNIYSVTFKICFPFVFNKMFL